MTNIIEYSKFYIDQDRAQEVCSKLYKPCINESGIYKRKYELTPQWNMSESLEFSPKRTTTPNPLKTVRYLFLMASKERRSLAKTNIKIGKEAWDNPRTRWIFNPLEVSKRNQDEILEACGMILNYVFSEFPQNYLHNCMRISELPKGDIRELIHNQTVAQARKNLEELKGIGPGLSNLLLTYFTSRELVTLTDPENRTIKIDVNKARILLNTKALIPKQDRIRRDQLVKPLEGLYRKIHQKKNWDPNELDSAVWIPGSEICSKRSYAHCHALCPLEKLCISNFPEDQKKSEFVLYETNEKGQRVLVDSRRNNFRSRQLWLPFN